MRLEHPHARFAHRGEAREDTARDIKGDALHQRARTLRHGIAYDPGERADVERRRQVVAAHRVGEISPHHDVDEVLLIARALVRRRPLAPAAAQGPDLDRAFHPQT